MKFVPIFRGAMLAATLAAGPALVFASDDCDVPIDRWQSREAVQQLAAEKGWDLQRIKIDDGCYEVRGREASGREFKAKLDPQSLEVVKIKYRKRHDARDSESATEREGSDHEAADRNAAEGKATTPPSTNVDRTNVDRTNVDRTNVRIGTARGQIE